MHQTFKNEQVLLKWNSKKIAIYNACKLRKLVAMAAQEIKNNQRTARTNQKYSQRDNTANKEKKLIYEEVNLKDGVNWIRAGS